MSNPPGQLVSGVSPESSVVVESLNLESEASLKSPVFESKTKSESPKKSQSRVIKVESESSAKMGSSAP